MRRVHVTSGRVGNRGDSIFISIAMTTHNGEKFLKKQLDSILSQSHENFELIVSDDCSTDSTLSILQSYARRDSRIKIYRNDKCLGLIKNFEKAISLCSADYIALSDQDDIWDSDKLKVQISAILEVERKNPGIPVMVHSDLTTIDKDDRTIGSSYMGRKGYVLKNDKDLAHILGPNGVMGNTMMFNRKLLEHAMPFPRYLAVHDYWLALINELSGKRVTLRLPLVKYRIHGNNSSNHSFRLFKKGCFSIGKILRREFCLPYRCIAREYLLHEILKTRDLSKRDKWIIKSFMDYLQLKGDRLDIFFRMRRYGLLKRRLTNQIFLFFAIMLAKDSCTRFEHKS
jgi:rhamnosyltransferase